MALGFAIIVFMMFGWLGQVVNESVSGIYNSQVDRSFRWGMSWFIFSEVMFFAAFFGALFYARQLSVPWLGGADNNIYTPESSPIARSIILIYSAISSMPLLLIPLGLPCALIITLKKWEVENIKQGHITDPFVGYIRQVIITTEDDPNSIQDESRLAAKYPNNTTIVHMDINGNYKVVYGLKLNEISCVSFFKGAGAIFSRNTFF
jgi:hypothetical protein